MTFSTANLPPAIRAIVVWIRITPCRRALLTPLRQEGMHEMKTLGFVLVLFGVLAVVYGGLGYNRQTTVFDVGGIKATTTEHKMIPITPIAGGIALLTGTVLLLVPRKRVG
jgi:hypothetical protein